MSVTRLVPLPHPLGVAVEQIEAALDRMPLSGWDDLIPAQVRDLVERLMRVEARVKAHQLAGARVLDESGLARSQGATSTGAMLAGAFGGDRRAGDQMVRMGNTLQSATRTGDALARATSVLRRPASLPAPSTICPPTPLRSKSRTARTR